MHRDQAHIDDGLHPTDLVLTEAVGRREDSPEAWSHALHAFEVLYRRHGHRLLGFLATRVSRSDLDDVHQTVWQRVWQHLPVRFDGHNFRAWLHQIARNHVIDESRRKQADLLPAESEQRVRDPRDERPDDRALESERHDLLETCLCGLQDELAEIVRARLGGETYESICNRTGLTPARAHKLFHQAKEQLVSCFQRSYS